MPREMPRIKAHLHRERHSRHHSELDRTRSRSPARRVPLPFRAQHLSKHDLDQAKPLFALYLDVQKQIYIGDLDEREIKGRWKSFVGKWNRGELAEGWYDPQTRAKANSNADEDITRPYEPTSRITPRRSSRSLAREESDNSSDDEVGPTLPHSSAVHARAGPAIPSRDDLEMRDELRQEDQQNALSDLRFARKQDRTLQLDRLTDLAPKPDSGTREARLEKKRDTAYAQALYKESRESGGIQEVGDGELLGDDGVDAFKRKVKEEGRKKNEREVRKEEVLRARAAERDVLLQARREKEERTMEMLRGIARERFG